MLDVFYSSLDAFIAACADVQAYLSTSGFITPGSPNDPAMYDAQMLLDSGQYIVSVDGAVYASSHYQPNN